MATSLLGQQPNKQHTMGRMWSYGAIRNLIVYGTRDPPKYDLQLITVRTTMHYTVSDFLLDEKDVLAMASVMRNNTRVKRVPRESFTHEDFVAAFDAKEMVTDHVIAALKVESGMAPLAGFQARVTTSREK
ncbi:putative lysosomal acid lipase [Operophtera brumata]|uniref:Putative lysosomal acid lipase n=1 Tax=Operophtera brumata TaxID=104452 RepID=A0A0L7L4M8_OPEBR|nr:putative lysosomal acid lipase [Operophtera brumata]